MMQLKLLRGKSEELLQQFDDNVFDSIVTDPPYEIGIMNREWDKTGIAFNVQLWTEALRVMKPGAFLLAFGSTKKYHRLVCALEDAGFNIIDTIPWVYSSGFPKAYNAVKKIRIVSEELADKYDGFSTALKPAVELICMAQKPFIGTIADNVIKWGTGMLNIDGCRIPGAVPINRLEKWSGFGELKRPGYTQEMNEKGRWPANFVHDGSDEVISMFPETKSGAGGKKKNSSKGYKPNTYGTDNRPYGTEYIGYGDEGSAARFFYCAKTSKIDRDEGVFGELNGYSHDGRIEHTDTPYQRQDSLARNDHQTVKPTPLMRWLVRLVTPPNGHVLDMFCGSGSTGKACAIENFDFTGIDKDQHNLDIAKMRIDYINNQLRLL